MASEGEFGQRSRAYEPTSLQPLLPNPISLFDQHIKVLDQSYISFFQERARLEDQYISALSQLYQRSRYVDSQLDSQESNTTIRQAWREARDCLDREAESRAAFVSAVRNDVISPLINLKEANERTRKRIKEDIKDSYQAHMDFQDNQLPKMKQRYLKKVQELDEYKGIERPSIPKEGFAPIPHGFPPPQGMTSPTNTNFPNGILGGSPPNQPLASPQPQQPIGALNQQPSRPSNQHPVPRNRSPSASNSLSDLAQQSKKAIKGFLQDGDNRPAVLNSMRGHNPAMKTVKAKREAEEADKDYRKGVHWLETLRLRRATIIRSGYTSLEDFIWEEGLILKDVMQKYTDVLIGTAHTNNQLSSHIQGALDRVSLERDRDMQTRHFAQVDTALKRALPPTLYHNYIVGECSDLIFGTSLVDYATSRGMTGQPGVALGLAAGGKLALKEKGDEKARFHDVPIGGAQETVPRLVKLCVQDIDERGLFAEGIYRVAGRYANVQELRHRVEKDEASFQINRNQEDVFCIASLLKQYLRELPEPVFRFPLAERLQFSKDREEHISSHFKWLRSKMRRLPPVHQATLRLVIQHLANVAAHHDNNKMDAKNLSIVFASLLFGEDEIPTGADVMILTSGKDTLLEDMITHVAVIFDDKRQHSPSIPVTPLDAPATAEPGSAYTKVYSPTSPVKKERRSLDLGSPIPNRLDNLQPGLKRRSQASASPSGSPRTVGPTELPAPRSAASEAAHEPGPPNAGHATPDVDVTLADWEEVPPPPPPASEKRHIKRRSAGSRISYNGTAERKSTEVRRSVEIEGARKSFGGSSIEENPAEATSAKVMTAGEVVAAKAARRVSR